MKKTVLLMTAIIFLCSSAASAQTVYYNTEGGRYYHADPHCDVIDEKYWKSMAEISEEQALQMGFKGACQRCFKEEPVMDIPVQPNSVAVSNSSSSHLRFGGSRQDQINDLALTNDGRIVMAGVAASSDGTLSDRTKTGISGWVALVDLQGNTYWNFCSRHGSRDMMKAPVVQADGTITVLLESDGNEYDQTELIRLSMDGNVISRKTLVKIPKGNSGCAPEWPGVFSGGYVIATFDLATKIDFEPIYRYSTKPTYQPVYHWFDFAGNLLFKTQALWQNSVAQVSQNHVIEAIDQTYWLCSLDEKGNHTQLVKLYEGSRSTLDYRDLISLEDGGAAACCYQMVNGEESTFIQRWDAKGSLALEAGIKGFRGDRIQVVGEQIVVCGETGNENELMVIDAFGQIIRRQAVDEVQQMGRSLLALNDNCVLTAEQVAGNNIIPEYYDGDVQLSIVSIK